MRRAGEVLRRRVQAGATVHASSHATAARVRERPRSRARRGHPPRSAGPSPMPRRRAAEPVGRRARRPAVRARRSARSNAARTCRRWCGRSVPSPPTTARPGWSSPARRVTTRTPWTPRSTRSIPSPGARVVRPGSVDDATKSWLLHHARVLAYPSLDEGFGFPILEAQQVGLPVVATRAGSIPEIAGDGAELVPVGDADALAGALDLAARRRGPPVRADRRRPRQRRPRSRGGRPPTPLRPSCTAGCARRRR